MGGVSRVLEDARQSLGPEPGVLDFHWTRGLLRQFLGEYPLAISDLERAAVQVSGEDQHWECCWCASNLAVASLEQGDPVAAARWAEKLEEMAGRVGDGVERPAAAAIQALVRTAVDPGAWADLERSLANIRAADGRAMLSVLSNFAAEWALAQGRADQARSLAEEALAAATAVSRPSQAMVARAVLGRLALARGDSREVAAQLSELATTQALGTWAVSARARATAERLRNEVSSVPARPTRSSAQGDHTAGEESVPCHT
jgi:ATP/maltotriose-dependent transcriptional regulator MalT